METKELKLPNLNNCLACDAFIQIHFAPKESVPESALARLYHVKNGDEEFYCRLVDMLRVSFKDMFTMATLPATGIESAEWKAEWLLKYPDTKPDTVMAIYYYKKHKE